MSCLHFASRTARAQDSYQFRVSYNLWCGADTAPPFYAYPGRISNNPHESMETRCVLPSMRNIAVPADCTRPQLGAGRNRYVSAAPAWNRTPGLAVQKSKSRLSVAANKSCLQGRTSKIWSCAPAPYGKGTHVCAAFTGRVLQPVPGAVSALNSSLSEVASLCSTGTAPFFKAIPPHANPQNGARIDEQGKTP